MTNLEKIEFAEKRIKELELLINHWEISSRNDLKSNLTLHSSIQPNNTERLVA